MFILSAFGINAEFWTHSFKHGPSTKKQSQIERWTAALKVLQIEICQFLKCLNTFIWWPGSKYCWDLQVEMFMKACMTIPKRG